MPTKQVNLIKGDKTSIDTDYRDALPVNMYGVIRDILGSQGYMLCYPGLTQYATGVGIDRGANYNDRDAVHYRVSGQQLIKVDTDGTKTNLGAVSGVKQASMPYGFNSQAVIVDGKMFLYTERFTRLLTAPALAIGTEKDRVAHAAFTYRIDGSSASKAAVTTGQSPGTDLIPQNKFGAVAFDIDINGVVTAVPATGQTAGTYGTAALAVAALPVVASGKCRMGYVTASSTDPGGFQFDITFFDDAAATVTYVDGDVVPDFIEVTDPDLGDPIDGVWVDSYYFLTDGESIYHTKLTATVTGDNPELEIDPLDIATAEFMPDKSLGLLKTQDNKVMVFGRYSTEYFVNDASANFAFARQATRAQKIGIVATHAKCEASGRAYITGGRKAEALGVYVLGTGSAEKVSSREVDKLLAEYTEPELSDMRMESYMEDGVTFVLVHLPDYALCFNETVAKKFGINIAWSILKSDVQGATPYRGINGVFESNRGQWIYGDKQNSNIGILDNTVFTHYGSMVEWILFSPLMKLDGNSLDEIEIETIPGNTGSSDAKVAISLTYNGLTYGNEWFEMYGEPLDYGKRFFIRRLGVVNDYVGTKLRGATTSRMAFGSMGITYA